MNVHGIRELESLEVGVRDDVGRRSEVFNFVKFGHDLRTNDAAELVDELDGRPLAVVRDAVPDDHVELVLLVLDAEHHGHRLTDLDDPAHLARPGSFAGLDLHPALEVVPEEVGGDGVQHVHLERSKGHRLLVVVVPGASEFTRLKIHLKHFIKMSFFINPKVIGTRLVLDH